MKTHTWCDSCSLVFTHFVSFVVYMLYIHHASYMMPLIWKRRIEWWSKVYDVYIWINSFYRKEIPLPQLIVRKLVTEIEFYEVEMLQFPIHFFDFHSPDCEELNEVLFFFCSADKNLDKIFLRWEFKHFF